jgi:hypothetical protein
MPAVSRRNQNAVNISPLSQELTYVPVHRAILGAILVIDHLFNCFTPVFPYVTDGNKLDIRFTHHPVQISGTAPSYSDSAHHDSLARRNITITAQRRCRDIVWKRHRACRNSGSSKELSSCY